MMVIEILKLEYLVIIPVTMADKDRLRIVDLGQVAVPKGTSQGWQGRRPTNGIDQWSFQEFYLLPWIKPLIVSWYPS